jgi:APA family basic amino acid/polyamine antiporter
MRFRYNCEYHQGEKPMENKLEKKYGLLTAICMVVGIVIGSGVFFKAEAVLVKTGGNMPLGIWAWADRRRDHDCICSYVFAVMAGKYSNVNGLVDYAEATVGKNYAYAIAWFSATIYTPAITSVLAWVSPPATSASSSAGISPADHASPLRLLPGAPSLS